VIIRCWGGTANSKERKNCNYTVYSMLYTVCCILYAVYCMLYTLCCTLYAVYCILCAVHCILYAVYCMLYAVYCMLYDVYCMLYNACCILYAVYCMLVGWNIIIIVSSSPVSLLVVKKGAYLPELLFGRRNGHLPSQAWTIQCQIVRQDVHVAGDGRYLVHHTSQYDSCITP
jgi:hypothetical protein